ncbi:geranylgeranyl reductase family protein [Jiangella gansuensis]|uniref:geranylgeranyl reductase family protein n=1 Tax=Jiangella gansuensis TaxID=281473 RepID=UPI00047E91E1|nr:geranylgeranyl reductase family protein [Jiangella gansuensis]
MNETWDLVVVGAGPAGTAAALGALSARPGLRVLLLDRAGFPRDKPCGDGIAPHVLDVLAGVGLTGLLDDWTPVHRLELSYRESRVSRPLRRPTWVVPRTVFDQRLVAAAIGRGAVLRVHRVRRVRPSGDGVLVDDDVLAPVVIGADGANSLARAAVGLTPSRRRAIALRGYTPTAAEHRGRQVIVYDGDRSQAYAWAFDRGDGLANVGYGELSAGGTSRAELLARLEALLPGTTTAGTGWRGHHLPLSSWRWAQPDGPVLLAGDAAGLVNPMTGEGIYYAVATGVLAGRAAADAVATGRPESAGARYRSAVRALLARHLRHTAATARLAAIPTVLTAGMRAARRDQQIFDDLVEIGLGQGLLTRRVVAGLAGRGSD